MRETLRPPALPWFALAASAALCSGGPSPVRAGDPVAAPAGASEEALVATAFTDACDAVERICGAKFRRRPVRLAVSEDEFADLFMARENPIVVSLGLEEDDAADARAYAREALAVYDPDRHAAVVRRGSLLPWVGRVVNLPDERLGALRLLFTHEATHALDWERFPMREARISRGDAEARMAFSTVLEGHAEWVEDRAAREWGLGSVRAMMRPLSTATGEPKDPWAVLGEGSWKRPDAFLYGTGCAFVDAVFAAQGAAGVERLLRDPPRTTRAISMPETWLDPALDRDRPDVDGAAAAVDPLVADPAWRTASIRLTPGAAAFLDRALRAVRLPVAVDRDLDGRVALAGVPYGPESVLFFLRTYPAEAAAQEALTRLRASQREKDADALLGPLGVLVKREETDGAGTKDAVTGFRVRRAYDVTGGAQAQADLRAFVAKRTLGVLFVSAVPEIPGEAQDRVVSLAAAVLEGRPEGERPAAPVAVTLAPRGRTLVVRVLDPAGAPVPRVNVALIQGEHARKREARDGRAEFRVPRDAVLGVEAWGARGADGLPLPLAWSGVSAVAANAESVDVRLRTGLSICGTVEDREGRPVEGAAVSASWPRPDLPAPQEHGRAETAADGTFTVLGLAMGTYLLKVRAPRGYADPPPRFVSSGAEPVRIVLRW